jgi:hypothetical protein
MQTFHRIFQLIDLTSLYTDPDYNEKSKYRTYWWKLKVQIISYLKKSYSDDFENNSV